MGGGGREGEGRERGGRERGGREEGGRIVFLNLLSSIREVEAHDSIVRIEKSCIHLKVSW